MITHLKVEQEHAGKSIENRKRNGISENGITRVKVYTRKSRKMISLVTAHARRDDPFGFFL